MSRAQELIALVDDETDDRLPALARRALGFLVAQIRAIQEQIGGLEQDLLVWHRASGRAGALRRSPAWG